MRLLIAALLWAVASVPLALVVGRAINGTSTGSRVADEAESYLAGRTRPDRSHWMAPLVGAGVIAILVVVAATAALHQLPAARVFENQTGINISATTSTTADHHDGTATAPTPATAATHSRRSPTTAAPTPASAVQSQEAATGPAGPANSASPASPEGPARVTATPTTATDGNANGRDDRHRPHHADPTTSTTQPPDYGYAGPPPPPSTTTTEPRDDRRGPDSGTTTSTSVPATTSSTAPAGQHDGTAGVDH